MEISKRKLYEIFKVHGVVTPIVDELDYCAVYWVKYDAIVKPGHKSAKIATIKFPRIIFEDLAQERIDPYNWKSLWELSKDDNGTCEVENRTETRFWVSYRDGNVSASLLILTYKGSTGVKLEIKVDNYAVIEHTEDVYLITKQKYELMSIQDNTSDRSPWIHHDFEIHGPARNRIYIKTWYSNKLSDTKSTKSHVKIPQKSHLVQLFELALK